MTGGRAFDHVVLAEGDLARTAAIYEELGFTLTPRAANETASVPPPRRRPA